MGSALDLLRHCKLGLERVLASGVKRHRQTDAEREMNPTPDGIVEIPLTDDERSEFERQLTLFTQAVRLLEPSNPESP